MLLWHNHLSWNNSWSSILGPSESPFIRTAGVCFATNIVPTGTSHPLNDRQCQKSVMHQGYTAFMLDMTRHVFHPWGFLYTVESRKILCDGVV